MPQLRVESEKIIESSVRVCIPPMRANITKPNTCSSLLFAKDCQCKKENKTTTHQELDTRFDLEKKHKVSQVNKDQIEPEKTTQCKESNCDPLLDNQTSSLQYHEELSLFDLDIDPVLSLKCECNKTKTTDDAAEISDKISELILSSSLETNKRSAEDQILPLDNESKLKSTAKVVTNSAERFFLESGILGTMGLASSILKKSSKINPILNDSSIKEVIRKNSLVLLGPRQEPKRRSISENRIDSNYHRANECNLSNQAMPVTLQNEIQFLKNIVCKRDSEINKLRSEIHKLHSVLQQTTANVKSCECGLISSIQRKHMLQTQITNNNRQLNELNDDFSAVLTERQQLIITKKQGVSGECCDTFTGKSNDILIKKYDKDFSSKQQIKDAIQSNDFLKHLDCAQIRELIDSMYSRDVDKGEFVVREGEPGSHFFVSAVGHFEIIVNGKVLGIMEEGRVFGELAILYNCTRTASIRAINHDSRVWVLDRTGFKQIMMRTGLQRIEENVKFLKNIDLLKKLSDAVLVKIADVLEVEFYQAGAFIVRQGTKGDNFFLISQGSVKVTQRVPGSMVDEEIRILTRGEYFGEQALINDDKRTANIIALPPGVECMTLDRESFKQHIGDLGELHEIYYGDHERMFAIKHLQKFQHLTSNQHEIDRVILNLQLSDLTTIATVGSGGFGRVMLVSYTNGEDVKVFALKKMKKCHILETKQEEHTFNEKQILLSLSSPFICRLFRTFRDSKFIYLLMEACMGGEIWTILRNKSRFDEQTAQFIVGCVIDAFQYLHSRGIVYRDLKPENLMVAENGYIKLVDFGFAKLIGYSSKTWTFCGTPEYVAPEVILNKGHDRAVDYWALGILIHELISGRPPFTSSDPLKTYNLILSGIDVIDFPRYVTRSAISLIKRLCRDNPTERLGYQRNGVDDVKKHRWFQGFDFDGLSNLTLQPPEISIPIQDPFDISNFDTFLSDDDTTPDEISGWDADF